MGPARVRLRGGAVLVELADRFGEAAAAKVLAGEVVCADGAVVTAATVLPPNSDVYLYRDLPDEAVVPFDIPVLYRDDEHRGGRQAALPGDDAAGRACRADGDGAAAARAGSAGVVARTSVGPVDGGRAVVHGAA